MDAEKEKALWKFINHHESLRRDGFEAIKQQVEREFDAMSWEEQEYYGWTSRDDKNESASYKDYLIDTGQI